MNSSEILRRIARVRDDRLGRGSDDRHWRDVRGGVAHVLVERTVDRHRRGGNQNGVAIRLRLGDRARPEVAAGAALVFHHHLLTEFHADPIANGARHAIGESAGCGRDDDGDGWPGGLRLARLPASRRLHRERGFLRCALQGDGCGGAASISSRWMVLGRASGWRLVQGFPRRQRQARRLFGNRHRRSDLDAVARDARSARRWPRRRASARGRRPRRISDRCRARAQSVRAEPIWIR